MASSSIGGEYLSPEKTVTSLLSSSGHLRSSLQTPDHDFSFRFREKVYDSASAALDAYIADFERSCQKSKRLTGSMVLPPNQATTSKPRVGMLRNRDVLRERLTETELDFLYLPVSSLHHQGNRDRLSMTTDELLSIPYDGSLPVTHTSACIHAHRTCSGLNSCHAAPCHINQHHSLPDKTSRSYRRQGRPKVTIFEPAVDTPSYAHRKVRSEWDGPSSLLHLPHWLTSNKAEIDCSEISSLPDLPYPAWIQSCGVSVPPPPQSELWEDHVAQVPGAPKTGAPSWVSDLMKNNDFIQPSAQGDSQQTLRNLRLQLAEHISLLGAKRESSDIVTNLFKDNKIESLIQKADQVLNSLSQSSKGPESLPDPASPVNTEDLLNCSPPHCPPLSPDSAAGESTEALTQKEKQVWDHGPHGNGIWKQPGPVEALKQMLFKLQAVEGELQRKQGEPPVNGSLQTPVKPVEEMH
ncbi:unnamed protein product [Menidia menidia]|uniref:(Atlantic silverside) hypothetical protein n=1 Tax=Menidia menidia TaxID=238744 RepID=A0A8S4AFY1_9TELE|nr:unnamed protein product [Menidia menidia]